LEGAGHPQSTFLGKGGKFRRRAVKRPEKLDRDGTGLGCAVKLRAYGCGRRRRCSTPSPPFPKKVDGRSAHPHQQAGLHHGLGTNHIPVITQGSTGNLNSLLLPQESHLPNSLLLPQGVSPLPLPFGCWNCFWPRSVWPLSHPSHPLPRKKNLTRGRPTPTNKWVPSLRRPILCCCLPEARRGPCSRCHQDCKGTDIAREWKAMTGCYPSLQ